MRGQKGFTLVELLIVIGICGFFLVFSFPTAKTFQRVVYLNASAQALASDLRRTQMLALCSRETKTCQNFKFSKTGASLPGGFGTTILGEGPFSKKVIVSQIGRVRVE